MTDVLSVLVTKDASGNVALQVTASSEAAGEGGRGTARLVESSHDVVEAATRVVDTCK